MKFKKGDKVIVTDEVGDEGHDRHGEIGEVYHFMNDNIPYPIGVAFDNGECPFREDELELLLCRECDSERVYHDKKKRWACLFCEL